MTLGAAGAGLCCPQPGQLLPACLSPATLEVVRPRFTPHRPRSCHCIHHRCWGKAPWGSSLPDPGDWGSYWEHSALGPILDSAWHPESYPCPQPCGLGRIQSPRSICRFTLLLRSFMPFSRPLRLGSMPSYPLREGLLSQQNNYPKCQQQQQHLEPPA